MTVSETEQLRHEFRAQRWSRRDRALFLMGLMTESFELTRLFQRAEEALTGEEKEFAQVTLAVLRRRVAATRAELRKL